MNRDEGFPARLAVSRCRELARTSESILKLVVNYIDDERLEEAAHPARADIADLARVLDVARWFGETIYLQLEPHGLRLGELSSASREGKPPWTLSDPG